MRLLPGLERARSLEARALRLFGNSPQLRVGNVGVRRHLQLTHCIRQRHLFSERYNVAVIVSEYMEGEGLSFVIRCQSPLQLRCSVPVLHLTYLDNVLPLRDAQKLAQNV